MQSYFGRTISTAFPRSSSSRRNPHTTSPRPPAWTTGAHSGAIITTYTTPSHRSLSWPDLRPPTTPFVAGRQHASPGGPRGTSLHLGGRAGTAGDHVERPPPARYRQPGGPPGGPEHRPAAAEHDTTKQTTCFASAGRGWPGVLSGEPNDGPYSDAPARGTSMPSAA